MHEPRLRPLISKSLYREGTGADIYAFAGAIFPICRSITGEGVRETLAHVKRLIDLDVHEVPSGTPVLDWTIPREWSIRDAWIKDPAGRKIIDFKTHNLHVLNYSTPISARLPLAELRKHIYTIPTQPDLIPYRTSYYRDNWGFCMSHNQFIAMADGEYEAFIDSSHDSNGSLTYGEYFLQGETEEEFLFSAHCCHPSLANDNCAGIGLCAHLARALASLEGKTRYSYRFLFAPGTIGSITWLARNEARAQRIKHGLVLTCVGDCGGPTYKRSQRGDALIDRASEQALRESSSSTDIRDFWPYGYDERQYCSPAFNLPVGLFMRSTFAEFPEYHTSGDNMDLIKPEILADSFKRVLEIIDIVENDFRVRNLSPQGEPNLGKRGLYGGIGGDKSGYDANLPILWVLNQADGARTLLDIARRAKLPYARIHAAVKLLDENGLLRLA